ncbi:Delta(12) fatty acid desaturase [Sphaerulina musiva]
MAPSKDVTVGELRKAVPDHCFRASALRSTAHIIVDLTLASTLAVIGYLYINQIETSPLRWLTWAAYGYLQGLFFVGIWILAHEGGHGALYSSNAANNAAGFVLHSVLMVPYFSWKYTHARHHRYHNHMEKDTAFVPHREGEKTLAKKVADMLGHTEDAPLYHLALLILHQTFGWQAYMLSYASGGSASTPGKTSSFILWNSHFNPEAGIWTKSQRLAILASTFGVAAVFIGLCILGTHIGMTNVLLLYGVPYMWVNNWLVAITYLHHTHPDNQHFEADRWNYTDGALETVDRPFGFIGKHIFHGIIDCHVVHHLFPSIPFYHAEEATEAIRPMLGNRYKQDSTPFWLALWQAFTTCHVVKPAEGKPGVLQWAMKSGRVKTQ